MPQKRKKEKDKKKKLGTIYVDKYVKWVILTLVIYLVIIEVSGQ